MLNLGNKLILLRKDKGLSQGELAKKLDASREIIGKYERNENLPSIEMALKLANVFDVTVDYLLGIGTNSNHDKKMVKRLEDINVLPEEDRQKVFEYIDLVIRDYKTRQAYS